MGESTETKVFSLEEVKKHVKGGSEKDVWIVIHDNVYDVTKFLDEVSNKLATCPLHVFVSFLTSVCLCSILEGKRSFLISPDWTAQNPLKMLVIPQTQEN